MNHIKCRVASAALLFTCYAWSMEAPVEIQNFEKEQTELIVQIENLFILKIKEKGLSDIKDLIAALYAYMDYVNVAHITNQDSVEPAIDGTEKLFWEKFWRTDIYGGYFGILGVIDGLYAKMIPKEAKQLRKELSREIIDVLYNDSKDLKEWKSNIKEEIRAEVHKACEKLPEQREEFFGRLDKDKCQEIIFERSLHMSAVLTLFKGQNKFLELAPLKYESLKKILARIPGNANLSKDSIMKSVNDIWNNPTLINKNNPYLQSFQRVANSLSENTCVIRRHHFNFRS